MGFFARLFPRSVPALPSPPQAEPPAQSPPWVSEVLDQLQKLGRSNARFTLRLEDLEKKVEGGFAELRTTLAAAKAVETRPDEFLDALDALDEACRAVGQSHPEVAQGLERVSRRLEQLSLRQMYVRLRPHGQPPDGRLFKVVGTTSSVDVPEGLIARVVRAAVTTRDGAVVREGEVLTSRKDA